MRRLITLACVATALLAAGCGDDEDSEGSATTPAATTQAQPPPGTQDGAGGRDVEAYRAELRGQCSDIKREIERLGEPDAETPSALGDFFEEILDLSREQQRDFESVEPPERFADRHRDAVRLGKEVLRLTKGFTEDLQDGRDPARLLEEFGPKVRTAAQRSNEFYEEVGVPACRVDPTTGVIGGEPA